jgi:hypothetical protein
MDDAPAVFPRQGSLGQGHVLRWGCLGVWGDRARADLPALPAMTHGTRARCGEAC